jgi:hypothetical protein
VGFWKAMALNKLLANHAWYIGNNQQRAINKNIANISRLTVIIPTTAQLYIFIKVFPIFYVFLHRAL